MIGRPHTGGRRNEAAEQAILRAAAELLAAGDGVLISVVDDVVTQLATMETPSVAVINGHCIGAGCALAAGCLRKH